MDGISKVSHNAARNSCGIGYVILSRGQDKDTYISSSFRNNRVSIITTDSEVIPNCIVAKNAWQYLEFPDTIDQRGSQVLWINIPHQNRVVILDIVHKRDELNPIQSTSQFKFQRKVGENIVTIQGDGKTGVINIISQGANKGEGEMYVKILNENELAILDIYVQGIVTVDIENELNFRVGEKVEFVVRDESKPDIQAILNYILGTGFNLLDEFKNNIKTNDIGIFNEVDASVKVYARAIGAVSEPGLLGDKTFTLLNEIVNLLTSMVTTLQTASGSGTFVLNAPIVAQIVDWVAATVKMKPEIQVIKAKNFELS